MPTLGKLIVDLEANTAQFAASLNQSRSIAQKFSSSISDALKIVGAGAVAAGVAFTAMAKNAINTADDMAKLSQKVGVSVESLSALQHAAGLSGVSTETMQKGLQRLAQGAVDMSRGIGEAKDAFEDLGISVFDAGGNLKSTEQLMLEVADRFAQMEDGTTKTAAALDIFGRAGADMIPMLNAGSAGIREMMGEAQALGIVLSTETAQAAEKFNDDMSRLQTAVQGVVVQILSSGLLDGLVVLSESLVEIVLAAKENTAAWKTLASVLTFPIKLFFEIERVVSNVRASFNAFLVETLKLVKGADELLGSWSPFKNLLPEIDAKIDQFALAELHARDEAQKWSDRQAKLNDAVEGLNKPAAQAARATRDLGGAARNAAVDFKDFKQVIEDIGFVGFIKLESAAERFEREMNAVNQQIIEASTQGSVLRGVMDDLAASIDRAAKVGPVVPLDAPVVMRSAEEIQRILENIRNNAGSVAGDTGESFEDAWRRSQKGAESFSDVVRNQVSTIFSDLSKGIAESIVKWEGMWDTFKNVAQQFATAIIRLLLERLFNPLLKLIDGALSKLLGFSKTGTAGATAGGFGIPGLGGGIGEGLLGGLGLIGGGAFLGNKAFGGISGGLIGGGLGLAGAGSLGLLGSLGAFGAFAGPIGAAIAAAAGLFKLIQALGPERGFKGGAVDLVRDLGVSFQDTDEALKQFAQNLGLTEKQFDGLRVDIGRSPAFFQNFLLPAAQATGQVDELIASFSRLKVSAGVGAGVEGLTKIFEDQKDVIFDLSKEVRAAIEGNFEPLNEAYQKIFGNSQALISIFGNIPAALLGVSQALQDVAENANTMAESFDQAADSARALGEATKQALFPGAGAGPKDFGAIAAGVSDMVREVQGLTTKFLTFGGGIGSLTRTTIDPFTKTSIIGPGPGIGLAQEINALIDAIRAAAEPLRASNILRDQFKDLLASVDALATIAIPQFGHGAIVNRPTLGIVGESGPEAIVPLGRGLRQELTINVNASGFTRADREMAAMIGDQINRQIRTNERGVRTSIQRVR